MTPPPLRRIYEAAAYGAASLDGCYWADTASDAGHDAPLQGLERADVAIVGAGFAGLSAALHLAGQGMRTAVLDLHEPGWGASGRNGGFCCLGGAMASREQLIRRYGAADHARFRQAEMRAIEHVRQALDHHGIEADLHSHAGEVQLAHSPRAMAVLHRHRDEAARDYGVQPRLLDRHQLAAQGLRGTGFHGGLILPLGFALNPRKYVLGLARAARAAGVRLYPRSPVTLITRAGSGYRLDSPNGSMSAGKVLVATNGYSAENLPDWMRARYLPVQSSILVTRPLTPEEIAAQGWLSDLMAFDTRHLLHYFRLMPDRRVLFGMRGGLRWRPSDQQRIRQRAHAHFREIFPAWAGVEITHFWSGLANLTRDLVPFAGPVPGMPGVWAAFGWHGNGVAMASWTGNQIARRILGQPDDLPGFFGLPPRRFELGAARRLALWAAYAWYELTDG